MEFPEIKFSRHAKRRLKLYKIDEETVSTIISNWLHKSEPNDGKYEVKEKVLTDQYDYPIKTVFSKEKGKIIVITAYPLKKEMMK